MARKWTIPFKPNAFTFISGGGAPATLPTTNTPVNGLDDTTDESFIISGVIPDEWTGATLKLRLIACANTTTAADDAQIDVSVELSQFDNSIAMNVDDFDATPDSGTFTFSTTAYSLQALIITLTPDETVVKGYFFRIKITRDANHATLDSLVGDLFPLYAELYEE